MFSASSLLFYIFLFPVSIVLHELGHYFGATLVGIKIYKMGLGTKDLHQQTSITIGSLDIALGFYPFGYVLSDTNVMLDQSKKAKVVFSILCGPLANLILAILCCFSPTLYLAGILNLIMFMVNLYPIHGNDGWLAYNILFDPEVIRNRYE